MFGSLKNYLSGKSGDPAPGPSFKESDSSSSNDGMTVPPSRLADTVDTSRGNIGSARENHPGDSTDFYTGKQLHGLLTCIRTYPVPVDPTVRLFKLFCVSCNIEYHCLVLSCFCTLDRVYEV